MIYDCALKVCVQRSYCESFSSLLVRHPNVKLRRQPLNCNVYNRQHFGELI